MSLLFNKYIAIGSVLLLLFVSCTKEGLPGPEGEQGLPGPDGIGGGGSGGGGNTYILTYEMPYGTKFTWEPTTGGNYRLKYAVASHSGNNITLPDSVTKYIDEGALLIYTDKAEDADDTWQQIPFVPAEFYAIAGYSYTIEKVAGAGYRFSFLAAGQPRSTFTQLRFVIIPKTETLAMDDDI
jgi:hypothetical protein